MSHRPLISICALLLLQCATLASLAHSADSSKAIQPPCDKPASSQPSDAALSMKSQLSAIGSELGAQPPAETDECPLLDPGVASLTDAQLNEQVCQFKSVEELILWARGYQHCSHKEAEKTWKTLAQADEQFRLRAHQVQIHQIVGRQFQEEFINRLRFMDSHSTRDRLLASTYIDRGFIRINAILRGGGPAARCLAPLVSALNSVFRTLPESREIVWRGLRLSKEEQARYTPGKVMTWPAYSSTSRLRGVAENFEGLRDGGLLFKIQSQHCRDLTLVAGDSEAEVLCLPGARFKVVGSDSPGVVSLQEVE
jgi:hypothetical protein